MRLVITDELVLEDDFFAYWLLEEIKRQVVLKVQDSRIQLLETKYQDMPVAEIVQAGIEALAVTEVGTRIVIEIPPTQTFNKTSHKLVQLCRAINYGCLDIRAYPIFTDVFSSVSANVQSYYTRYEEELQAYVY